MKNFIEKYGEQFNYDDYTNSFISNRYKLLNNDWYISPRYPIWISIFLAPFWIIEKYFWIDIWQIIFFTFFILFGYLTANIILQLLNIKHNLKIVLAFLFWLMLFWWHYNFQFLAMWQIVREIPSLFFLWALLFSLLKYISNKNHYFLYLAVLFFWNAVLIRETNILFWVLFLTFIPDYFKKINYLFYSIIIFLIAIWGYFYILYEVDTLSSINPIEESFLNIDHIHSFSIDNFFRNYPSYLNYLWLDKINFFSLLLFIWLVWGLIITKKSNIKVYNILLSLILLEVILFCVFSAWPNPFHRYLIYLYFINILFIVLWIIYIYKISNNNIFVLFLIYMFFLTWSIHFNTINTQKTLNLKQINNIINFIQSNNGILHTEKLNNISNINIRENWYWISSYFPERTFIYNSENQAVNNILNTY